MQEFFVECFREGGLLVRSSERHARRAQDLSRFRAFLHGAVRNIALRFEKRCATQARHRAPGPFDPSALAEREATLSRLFDRAWAQSIMRQAVDVMRLRARRTGGRQQRRVELLCLRFHEGMPIRDIAPAWNEDPAVLHRELEKARKEFRDALREVLGLHAACAREKLEAECDRLLALLE